MELKKVIVSFVFAVMIIAWISSAVMTVIPDSASKVCYLGYEAHCSFTPFSTVISIVAAIITFLIAKRLLWR